MIEAYKEGCSTFRHYSAAALNIRVSTIAQVVVLMTAVGFLLKEGLINYARYAACFGFFFTFILLFLHENYQRKCSLFIVITSQIEKTFKLAAYPLKALHKDHERNVKSLSGELFITKGLFILLGLGFLFLLLKALFIF